jgi:hypothetical protein
MSYIVGRGRYARETYPVNPAAGAGPVGGDQPLVRTRFVDALTATPSGSQNGATSTPYSSVPVWLAAPSVGTPGVPIASDDDAETYTTAIVSGAPADAPGMAASPWTIPAYRNIEVRGLIDQSWSASEGTTFSDLAIHWSNADPHTFAPAVATLTLSRLNITGSLTLTDDGSLPSALNLVGTTGGAIAAQVENQGYQLALDSLGASDWEFLFVTNCMLLMTAWSSSETLTTSLYAENAFLTASESPPGVGLLDVFVTNSTVSGVEWTFDEGFFSATAIDSSTLDGDVLEFTGACTFGGVRLVAPSTAYFDGPSWQSFLADSSNTRLNVVAIVIGGYTAAPVAGANITGASNINLSIDGTGASVGFTQGGNLYTVTSLTGNIQVSLLSGEGESPGDTLCVNRTDRSGFTVTVIDQASSATIAILQGPGQLIASSDGTNWAYQEIGGNAVL